MRIVRVLVPPAAVATAAAVGLALDADTTVASLLLLLAVVGSALFGRASGVAAAVLGLPVLNYLFTPPTDDFSTDGDGLVAMATFALVGLLVGTLVTRSAELRRRAEAREREARARDERERRLELDAEVARTRAAFFAAAGHNLRTPLATISASAAALEDAGPSLADEDRAELLASIRTEADRLHGLISKVLALSRIRAGGLEPDLAPVDLAGITQATVARLGPALDGREVRLDIAPGPEPVWLDADLMGEVLLNLLENALEHSPEGGVVTVVARPDGAQTVVRVVDHGPGIPEVWRDAVFDEFVRIDPRPDRRGTGLGLAIVRAMVLAQGGMVRCLPTDGGGTTMEVRVPHGEPRRLVRSSPAARTSTADTVDGPPVDVPPLVAVSTESSELG